MENKVKPSLIMRLVAGSAVNKAELFLDPALNADGDLIKLPMICAKELDFNLRQLG